MKIEINFKSKKTWIVIGAVVLAIALALTVTYTAINAYKQKQNSETKTPIVNPTVADYEARMKAIDDKLVRINEELTKVKFDLVLDNFTKYNFFGLDDYFEIMKVDTIEASMFNFVNEDIYLMKIMPISDLVSVQTFYYKDNEFTALDVEGQGGPSITRYYIYKQQVIAEKVITHPDKEKNGTVKMYITPLKFEKESQMIAVSLNNYNYSKDESISTLTEALTLANKAILVTNDTVIFDRMEMLANKEYYVFKEMSNKTPSNILAWIYIEKETGKAMYKETSTSANTLITKDQWNEKNETMLLKIYYPNNNATEAVARDYMVNKATYTKDKSKELVKIMNSELGLGINTIVVTGDKAVVDISKTSSENKFDNGSAGALMAVESLTKTIFANTDTTTLKVTVDGIEKVEGNHFSFKDDFTK